MCDRRVSYSYCSVKGSDCEGLHTTQQPNAALSTACSTMSPSGVTCTHETFVHRTRDGSTKSRGRGGNKNLTVRRPSNVHHIAPLLTMANAPTKIPLGRQIGPFFRWHMLDVFASRSPTAIARLWVRRSLSCRSSAVNRSTHLRSVNPQTGFYHFQVPFHPH